MKFSAWYGIVVGFLMIAQWTFFIATGSVPELQTEPFRIAFHLAAEFTSALMLIASGIATLKSIAWGKNALLVGLGMVVYSEIVSPGYFAQLGQWALVTMFAVLLFGAIFAVMRLLKE
ncbi:MAG: hypothetical protein JW963_14950 [Anaerolineales bacterium]|nr:hypothetical protein [Anaerolineales bacterium]